MRVLLCDDEPIWIERIIQLLQKSPYYHEFTIISSYENDISTMITQEKFDLAYLDILLQNSNGIDIARTLTKVNPLCLIIFVTNYQQYVSDAFSLEVFQYLFKPLDEKLFLKELHRAYQKYKTFHTFYPINTSEGKQYIQPRQIMYIETYYKIICIVTTHHIYQSHIRNLRYIKTFLFDYDFIQTHQSFYVNMNYIQKIYRNTLTLTNHHNIPIAMSKRRHIQNTFYLFLQKKDKAS